MLQLVTGFGATGEHLARSGVDKIAFTGSAATARKVMAACAENLTPLVAECGGKDAFLVGADADLDAAADACAWGAHVQRRARPASASSGSTWSRTSTTRSWRSSPSGSPSCAPARTARPTTAR